MKPRAGIAAKLLGWYDAHARVLPWRIAPGSGERPDPYRVWLSEIMLQQTTVAAAAPYFARFVARWPTVEALAAADEADVLGAWAGLGYYARARNLVACARAVASAGGRFPDSEAALRRLPGIGDYTAAAIAAIAFGRRAVVIDANVARVVARLFAIAEPLPLAARAIRAGAESITPERRAGDFAQAMMDLGATVCVARAPLCLLCPLAGECAGRRAGIAASLPVRPLRKARPHRTGTAFWIERDGEVLLVERAGSGMLGGMRALPDDGWSARADGSGKLPAAGAWRMAEGIVQHGFTHFTLELRVAVLRVADEAASSVGAGIAGLAGEWWPVERIGEAGLPTVFARAARLAAAADRGIA